jgi:hypothetical protein
MQNDHKAAIGEDQMEEIVNLGIVSLTRTQCKKANRHAEQA